MIKIIASDLDGTLLNDKMVISKANVAAIKAAQRHGVHFIVATGRQRDEIVPLLKQNDITCPLITLNGGMVEDEHNNVITTHPLTPASLKWLLALLEQHHLYFEVITANAVYSNDQENRLENFAHLLMRVANVPYAEARQRAEARSELRNVNLVDDYHMLLTDPNVAICKIVAFSPTQPELLTQLRQQIEQHDPNLVVTASSSANIEINPLAAQKGTALRNYADKLGVALSDVMAIGDNNNDLSMLRVAGASYAMANGSAEAIAVAKFTTASNTEDGVAQAIMTELNR